jgi:enoyl-CoA hydratase
MSQANEQDTSSASDSPEVLVERRGRILLITLNRPDDRNAINSAVAQRLGDALDLLDADDNLSVGVVTGAGAGFCSGMDLKAFAREGTPRGLERLMQQGSAKPLIAAIEGFALAGGMELALVCDLLVASREAKFGLPEVKVGLLAAGGALVRLPARMPMSLVMDWVLTGRTVSAQEAHDAGLVPYLTDAGQALQGALELAERLAKNAPLSLAVTKQLVRQSQGLTEAEFWEMQRPLGRPVFRSEDAKEGARAFAQRREPMWKGK